MNLAESLIEQAINKVGPFKVGDPILYGKYKNKKGTIVAFNKSEKDQITVEIEPTPKGRKQNDVMSLFRIWTVWS